MSILAYLHIPLTMFCNRFGSGSRCKGQLKSGLRRYLFAAKTITVKGKERQLSIISRRDLLKLSGTAIGSMALCSTLSGCDSDSVAATDPTQHSKVLDKTLYNAR